MSTELAVSKSSGNRLGMTSVNTQGYLARIISYNSSRDFVVEFEDGTILSLYKFSNFVKGIFRKPLDRTGEERVMNNGLKCRIEKYFSSDNMIVRFENGIIKTNVRYSNFINRNIALEFDAIKRVKLNCGVNAELISFKDRRHIDLRLEDGTILKDKQYDDFIRGSVGHPSIVNRYGNGKFSCFTLIKRVYKYKGDVFYNCKCNNCGLHDILTPQEMIEHSIVCLGDINSVRKD